jgi:hypothetical protein
LNCHSFNVGQGMIIVWNRYSENKCLQCLDIIQAILLFA